MEVALEIALLWLAFGASHVLLSSRALRPRLVAVLGERGHLAAYSVIALAVFVPLVWLYFAERATSPWLWTLPRGPVLQGVVYVGMGVAFSLLATSFATPSPASLVPGRATARGVLRITRHPLVMSLGLFGLLHLLPNGRAADLAFFGGFPVFALVGCWHQDRRKLAAGDAGFRAFCEATPFLPFTGRETLRGLRELPPLVVGLAVAVTVALRYLHGPLFGS